MHHTWAESSASATWLSTGVGHENRAGGGDQRRGSPTARGDSGAADGDTGDGVGPPSGACRRNRDRKRGPARVPHVLRGPGVTVLRIVDTVTGDTLAQLPPEQVLRMVEDVVRHIRDKEAS